MRADEYRNAAAELRVKAERAATPEAAVELRQLAHAYLRLAQDAERNALTDLVYEPPPPKFNEAS